MILKMTKLGIKWLVVITLMMMCSLCSLSFLSYFYLGSTSSNNNIDDIAKLLYKDNQGALRQTQGYHGVFEGYEGWDYTTFCGDTLYSPLPGRGVVTYNGYDGYNHVDEAGRRYDQNTMLRIEGRSGKVILLHGNYSLVSVGDEVVGGVTPIGKNDRIGYASGCHTHLIWHPNENYSVVTNGSGKTIYHTGKSGNYGSVLNDYSSVYFVISSYIPSRGGVNCDSDCTTMASGDKVATWTIGRDGIYAAACPQEWPFGTKFVLYDQTYECRDRGGFINCYDIGDYDPAFSGLYETSYYAQSKYCWVDILNHSGVPYGTMTADWQFLK